MSEGVNSARSDLLGGAGWVGFGLLIVAESLRMDRFTAMGAVIYTMPGFVPGMIGCVVAFLGAVLMLRGWRRAKAGQHGDAGGSVLNRRIALMLVFSLTYAVGLIGHVPFWLATALFVAAFTWTFAPPEAPPVRRAVAAVLAGVVTSAVVTLVFQHIFFFCFP